MTSANSPAVLVVGAGPVGLLAAAELARHGVGVRIIDKLAEPTHESRAIAVHARSLDMLRRIGIVDDLIATGVKARGMEVFSGAHRLLRVPLDEIDAAYPFSLNTPQTETERVLGEHLGSLGVTVQRAVELTELTQDPVQVLVRLRHRDGSIEDLSVPWVIGADGARSTVRHLVGGKLEGFFEGERFLLGDVDAEHSLDPESMYTIFSPEGPLLVMPMRDGRARVMAQIHDAPGTPLNLHPGIDDLQKVVDRRTTGITLTKAHWMTTFELHHAQLAQYRWQRVFFAGDAAHIHSPAGGQGMNTGMQDAFNLAWKLAAVIAGTGGDHLLDSYHAERYPVAKSMIEYTERLSRVGTLRGSPQHLRNALMKAVSYVDPLPKAMASAAAQIRIRYRGGPLAAGVVPRGAKVAAGDHFPHIDDDLDRCLVEACGPGHATVTVAAGQDPAVAGGLGRQILIADTDAAAPDYDAVIADPQRRAARRLGLNDGGRVVVRPDGYIGAVSPLDDAAALSAYAAIVTR